MWVVKWGACALCNYTRLESLLYFMLQDLVKSHLMSAVRSEVEELRDKISKLEVNFSFLLFGF